MSGDDDSPFWAIPPYILLTDVLQLDKIEPWNVDVGKLMGGFLQEMKRMGDIDFRVSGNALYSASVIFMKKTRELVQLGILPPEAIDGDEDFEIPMIHPPFRLTNRRVTLQELLVAMDRVLTKGVRRRASPIKRGSRSRADQVAVRWEVHRANVEENIAEVLADINELMNIGEESKFVDLLMNNSRKEIVRVFFAILHLYSRVYLDDEDLEVQTQLEV